MKWKLFMCGMVLITAGCAGVHNPYANFEERGFTFDYMPAAVPGRTPAQLGQDYAAPMTEPVNGIDVAREAVPYYDGAIANPTPMMASSNP
jgi:hypothetical protein